MLDTLRTRRHATLMTGKKENSADSVVRKIASLSTTIDGYIERKEREKYNSFIPSFPIGQDSIGSKKTRKKEGPYTRVARRLTARNGQRRTEIKEREVLVVGDDPQKLCGGRHVELLSI